MAEIDVGTLRAVLSLQDQFSGPIEDASKRLGFMGTALGVITGAAAAAVGSIAATTGAVVALGMRGAEVNDVRDAFAQLTARAGESADVMLGKLQEGTLGTISNFDLMKMSNAALSTGLVKSADDMGTLAQGAQLLSDRTGTDLSSAFETLTGAMATGRAGGLKQLGLFADTDVAVKRYADSLHLSVGDLTDHQRAVAASQAILGALKGELNAAGPAQVDFGDQVNRSKVAVLNLVDGISSAVASSPALVAAAGMIADGLKAMADWVGKNQQAIRELVSDGLVKLSGGLNIALVAIGAINEGFRITRVALIDLTGFLTKAAFGFEFLQKVKDHPLEVATAFEDLTAKVQATDVVVAEMTNSANEQAGSFAGLIEKVGMANANFAMLAATTGAVTETVKKLPPVIRDLGDQLKEVGAFEWSTAQMDAFAQKTQDDMVAIAGKWTEFQNQITLASLTGLDQRLADIDIHKQAEIDSLTALYGTDYPELLAMLVGEVQSAYALTAKAAMDAAATQEAAAHHAGDTQIDVAKRVLENALQSEFEIAACVDSTEAEIRAAHQKTADAKEALDKLSSASAVGHFLMIAEAASSILRSLFGKNKAAAIAAVIIDVAAGVVKSFAQYGWPWGLVPAAAIVAAGVANVAKIRSADSGFAEGTPGTAFMDFGRSTAVNLHQKEAVINMKQGGTLAGMIGDEMRGAGGGDPAMLGELRGLRDDLLGVLPGLLARSVRDARQLSAA